MTELISLHETEDQTEELEQVSFDPIPLDTNSTKTIYVRNLTNQMVTIEPEVSNVSGSGSVELVSYEDQIDAGEMAEVELKASAISTETISGLSADISVNAVAIVGPDQKL